MSGLGAVVAVAALAALMAGCSSSDKPAQQPPKPAEQAAAVPAAPVEGAAVDPGTDAAGQPEASKAADNLSVSELYKQARAAMSDNRIVAPAGSNALEYYLRILGQQPGDNNATDALRELFPFATGAVEDQINQGDFAEATRIMDLLAKADPSNYALTILRSKLDSKRRMVEREQAQRDAALAAAQAAEAAKAAQATEAMRAAAAAATKAEEEQAAAAAAAAAAARARQEAAAKAAEAPTPAPPPAAPVGGETRDARVLVPPSPKYPPAAVRNRQSGWVDVEFTVAADGSVQDAKVTGSQPRGVFDHEAVAAVQRAKFEPRLENGQPKASTLRRRIEFKLN